MSEHNSVIPEDLVDPESLRAEKSLDYPSIVFRQVDRINYLMTKEIASPYDWRGVFRFRSSVEALIATLSPSKLSRLNKVEKEAFAKKLNALDYDKSGNKVSINSPAGVAHTYYAVKDMYCFLLTLNSDIMGQVQQDEVI